MCAWASIYPSIHISMHLSITIYLRLYASLSVYLSLCLSVCLSAFPYAHPMHVRFRCVACECHMHWVGCRHEWTNGCTYMNVHMPALRQSWRKQNVTCKLKAAVPEAKRYQEHFCKYNMACKLLQIPTGKNKQFQLDIMLSAAQPSSSLDASLPTPWGCAVRAQQHSRTSFIEYTVCIHIEK